MFALAAHTLKLKQYTGKGYTLYILQAYLEIKTKTLFFTMIFPPPPFWKYTSLAELQSHMLPFIILVAINFEQFSTKFLATKMNMYEEKSM